LAPLLLFCTSTGFTFALYQVVCRPHFLSSHKRDRDWPRTRPSNLIHHPLQSHCLPSSIPSPPVSTLRPSKVRAAPFPPPVCYLPFHSRGLSFPASPSLSRSPTTISVSSVAYFLLSPCPTEDPSSAYLPTSSASLLLSRVLTQRPVLSFFCFVMVWLNRLGVGPPC